MSRRLVAGLVALVAVGGVFAYGLSKQDDVSKVDTKHVMVPPSGFKTFPAASIAGSTLDGINFWGSWCPGCRDEAPDLRAFANGLGSQASLVGVAIDSPTTDTTRFVRKVGWRYPIVRKACCDDVNRYGVTFFPTTVVVNSQGQVVDRLIGPQTVARLRAELRALGA